MKGEGSAFAGRQNDNFILQAAKTELNIFPFKQERISGIKGKWVWMCALEETQNIPVRVTGDILCPWQDALGAGQCLTSWALESRNCLTQNHHGMVWVGI